MVKTYQQSLRQLSDADAERFELQRSWMNAFVSQSDIRDAEDYIDEAALVMFVGGPEKARISAASVKQKSLIPGG